MDRARLVHHDLITVALGRSRPGIYWLRLYLLDTAEHVAVITEVPGDPSQSATNAISRIAVHMIREFTLDPKRTRLYQISPSGYGVLTKPEVQQITVSQPAPKQSRHRASASASHVIATSFPPAIPLPYLPGTNPVAQTSRSCWV